MQIKEDTLTKNSVIITILDSNVIPRSYGIYFRIDKKDKNTWKEWDHKKNYLMKEPAAVVENGKTKIIFDWSKLYEDLTPGEYRFVQEIDRSKNLEYTIEFNFR